MCVLVTTVENFQLLTPFCNTDAPESRYDHNDNRSHPDAPLSSRLCLRVPHRVRYAQLPFRFYSAQRGCYHLSAGDALEPGTVAYSRSKLPRASIILSKRTSRNLVEVTVHKAFEQPTTQTKDDGSCETANVQMDEKPTEWNLGDDTVRTV